MTRPFCFVGLLFISFIFTRKCLGQSLSLIQHGLQIASSDISILSTGPMSLYANPAAGLYQEESWSFLLTADRRYTTDLGSYSASASKTFGSNSLGLLVGNYGINGFRENRFGISFSRKIGQNAFLGIQGNINELRIENLGKSNSFHLNIGYWHQINEQITISAYFKNPIQPAEGNRKSYGKFDFSIGYIISPKLTLLSGIDVPWEERINFKSGFRYTPISPLGLIVSFSTAPSTTSFGLSLNFPKDIRLDMGYNSHPLIGNVLGLSMGYAVH